MNKKVVAYCRVSTANQKEEGTIGLQVDAISEYCKVKGYTVFRFFKDEGVSGGLESRPALADLFSYLESKTGKAVESVVIWKLDRLARDLYIQEHLIRKLEQLGKQLISTKEPDLDSTDPMRKAFRQFMGIVSELEKAFITMRLSGGRIKKAKEGRYAGGMPALGYVSQDKELTTAVEEAKIVRRIFHLKRFNRLPMNRIAMLLNKERIPTKRGGSWHRSTVSYILKNPLYHGTYGYSGITSERGDLALIE